FRSDAPHPARAGARADEDREAHEAGRVDLEVAGDDGRLVEDPGARKALGNEPGVEALADPVEIVGKGLDTNETGCDALSGRGGQPVGREDLGVGRVEGARAD